MVGGRARARDRLDAVAAGDGRGVRHRRRDRGPQLTVAPIDRSALGLGLRKEHYARLWERGEPGVGFFEVIAENFLGPCASAADKLRRARELAPIVLHGVSLDLLGPDPLDRDHLRRLKALADRLDAPWVTDHLCWTRARGHQSHDLLPVPMSSALARWAARRAREVQDFLERPFGLENLSAMAAFPSSTLAEHAFYREVVEEAGCGCLLDVNNVFVSSANTGIDPLAYLDDLDPERILQVHVAGHQRPERGPIVDTHDRPVCAEVWDLYREAWRRLGPFPTLLEWDDAIPPYDEAVRELEIAGAARAGVAHVHTFEPVRREEVPPAVPDEVTRWQRGFLDLVREPLAWEPPRARARTDRYDPALVAMVRSDGHSAVERLRAYHEQYWFRLLTAMQGLYPTVAALTGAWRFNQLATAFLDRHPPHTHDIGRVGEGLPAFLEGSPWDEPVLREAAALDAAWTELFDLPPVPAWRPSAAELPGVADRLLVPSITVRRLELRWPVPRIRDLPRGDAPVPCPPEEPATWLLFRTPELDLARLQAPPPLALLLDELDRSPLAAAVARVGDAHPDVKPAQVRAWFEAGIRWGWWAGSAA